MSSRASSPQAKRLKRPSDTIDRLFRNCNVAWTLSSAAVIKQIISELEFVAATWSSFRVETESGALVTDSVWREMLALTNPALYFVFGNHVTMETHESGEQKSFLDWKSQDLREFDIVYREYTAMGNLNVHARVILQTGVRRS